MPSSRRVGGQRCRISTRFTPVSPLHQVATQTHLCVSLFAVLTTLSPGAEGVLCAIICHGSMGSLQESRVKITGHMIARRTPISPWTISRLLTVSLTFTTLTTILFIARRYASAVFAELSSCVRLSVRHKPVSCRNDWTNRAGFWHGDLGASKN